MATDPMTAKIGDTVTMRIHRWRPETETLVPAVVIHATKQRLFVQYTAEHLKGSGISCGGKRGFLRTGKEYPNPGYYGSVSFSLVK